MKKKFSKCLAIVLLFTILLGSQSTQMAYVQATEPTEATAPSIYAQQGKCRNHAAFSTLKTIKHPL